MTLKLPRLFLNLGAHAAQALEALDVFVLDPGGSGLRDDQGGESGQQRGDAKPDIQGQQKDTRAGNLHEAADELHEGLRDELVELVGIVIEARDQVAGFVLIEERYRQLLEFFEERVAQREEHAATNAAHGSHLCIACDGAADIDRHQDAGKQQQSVHVFQADVRVDNVADDGGADQHGSRADADGDERDDYVFSFANQERRQAGHGRPEGQLRTGSAGFGSAQGFKLVVHRRSCSFANRRSGRIPAKCPLVPGVFPMPEFRLP